MIVPVVDCRVVTTPEVACKLIKEPVDAFKTDVFVVVACIVPMVPFVDCRVVTFPEVACMFDTFKTDTFPVVD